MLGGQGASSAARTNILLMTATITPDNSPELARVDPGLRLDDYAQALSFYIDQLGRGIDGIVFVENSDSDVSTLVMIAKRAGAGDRVEFIAKYGKQSFPSRDRSYGESRLLDHAMATSRLIREGGEAAVVWKITGRYRVRNLSRMIDTAPAQFDLYCDIRNRPMHWLDLRFMAWTVQGYDRILRDVAARLGVDPREPVMHRYVTTLPDQAGIVPRYRIEPLVDGVRGWDNRSYAEGRALVKYLARAVSRQVLPFVWI